MSFQTSSETMTGMLWAMPPADLIPSRACRASDQQFIVSRMRPSQPPSRRDEAIKA